MIYLILSRFKKRRRWMFDWKFTKTITSSRPIISQNALVENNADSTGGLIPRFPGFTPSPSPFLFLSFYSFPPSFTPLLFLPSIALTPLVSLTPPSPAIHRTQFPAGRRSYPSVFWLDTIDCTDTAGLRRRAGSRLGLGKERKGEGGREGKGKGVN